MESRVIVQAQVNAPPEEKVNEAIKDLGDGWRVMSATTALAVFGIQPGTEGYLPNAIGPIHHCTYVTTVVMQKG